LWVLFSGGNVATDYADAAGVVRRPAGILKDGSVLVGTDYEEGVERRSGKECRVRCELYAGLADQSGGKREVVSSRRQRRRRQRSRRARARASAPAFIVLLSSFGYLACFAGYPATTFVGSTRPRRPAPRNAPLRRGTGVAARTWPTTSESPGRSIRRSWMASLPLMRLFTNRRDSSITSLRRSILSRNCFRQKNLLSYWRF